MTSVNTNFLVTWKIPTGGSSNSSDQDSQQLQSTYSHRNTYTQSKNPWFYKMIRFRISLYSPADILRSNNDLSVGTW